MVDSQMVSVYAVFMADSVLEVLMSGTQTAEHAGQISPGEADALRKEIQAAAALEEPENPCL